MLAPEALLTSVLKRLLTPSAVRRTPAGIEEWKDTDAGLLLTRRTNLVWLIDRFEEQDLELRWRLPCQLTEMYTKPVPSVVKDAFYGANMLYRHGGPCGLAVGNLLVFRLPEA